MNLLKKIYYGCTDLVPLRLLRRSSPVTSLFPYHHIVSDEKVPHIINLYPYKNVQQFTNDLDYLLKNFEPITPTELVEFVNQHQRLPEKKFLLTFDDGFREVYEVIAPELKKKGVPAIFFINPAFIDNKEMFYRNKISVLLQSLEEKKDQDTTIRKIASILAVEKPEFQELRKSFFKINQTNKGKLDEIAIVLGISFEDYLKKQQPWMTSEQLSSLSSQGFYLGAHSWDHPYYQSLTLDEQIKQTVESCNYIRQFPDQKTTFSFPHSDEKLSQELFDKLKDPSFGIDMFFGIQNQKNEIGNRMVHRFNAERPGISFRKQVKGLMTYMIIQKVLNKQTIQRSYA